MEQTQHTERDEADMEEQLTKLRVDTEQLRVASASNDEEVRQPVDITALAEERIEEFTQELETSKKEPDSAAETLSKLPHEVERLHALVTALESDKSADALRIAQLAQEMEHVRKSGVNEQQRCEAAVAAAESKFLHLRAELDALQQAAAEEVQQKEAAAEKKIADLTAAAEERVMEAEVVMEELRRAHLEEVQPLKKDVANLTMEVAQLRQAGAEQARLREKEAAVASAEIAGLTKQLDQFKNRDAEEMLQRSESDKRIASLSEEVDRLVRLHEEDARRLDESAATACSAVARRSELKSELDQIRVASAEAEKQNSVLNRRAEERIQHLTEEIEQLQKTNQEQTRIYTDVAAEFEKRLAALAEEAEQSRKAHTETTELLTGSELRIKRLVAEVEQLHNIGTRGAQDCEGKDHSSAEHRTQELAKELEHLRTDGASAELRIAELVQQIDQLRQQHARELEHLRNLESVAPQHHTDPRIAELTQELEQLKKAVPLSAMVNADDAAADLRAQLEERDSVIRQMDRGAEARSAAAAAEAADLRAQIDALVQASVHTKEELQQMRNTLSEREAALQTHRSALQGEQQKTKQLQADLYEARASRSMAEQQAAKLHRSEVEFLQVQKATEGRSMATTVPEAAALAIFGDLELGRSGATLADLGLGNIESLNCIDRILQGLAVLMAWRSDVRMTVFGVWLLCHILYMLHLFLARFLA